MLWSSAGIDYRLGKWLNSESFVVQYCTVAMGILASRYAESYESSEIRHEPVPRVSPSIQASVKVLFVGWLQLLG